MGQPMVPGYPYPPAPTPSPKRKKWPWVVGVIGVLVVIAVANGGKPANSDKAAGPTGAAIGNDAPAVPAQIADQPAAPAQHTVVYEVTGTAKASSITYTTDGMTSSNQESDVKLPWTKTLSLPGGESFQMVSVLAQGSSAHGKLKVTITVDGKLIKEASATGYGVAMANEDIGTIATG